MEQVNLEPEFYYFDIFLTETYKSLGQYELINNVGRVPVIFGELEYSLTIPSNANIVGNINNNNLGIGIEQITITGLTKSRLSEVKTYKSDVPYKLNVNGVFNITNDFIEYSIDNISYKTYLSDGLTIYTLTKDKENFDNYPLIWNANSVFIDIKKTLNAMIIDRGNITVYDYINKINNCDTLDDLLEIF